MATGPNRVRQTIQSLPFWLKLPLYGPSSGRSLPLLAIPLACGALRAISRKTLGALRAISRKTLGALRAISRKASGGPSDY